MSTIKVKTDYIRSMTENIEDGISRPLDFYHLDGDISFQADGVNYNVTFDDELDDKLSSYRLRTALYASNGLAFELSHHAINRLQLIRQTEQPNAAMIVVAKDKNHASALSKMLKRRFSIDATILTEDCTDPPTTLRKFLRSNDEVIIAVAMVTEGVNLKRTRVILDLTNKTTRLGCIQLWSRAIRKENFSQTGSSYVYSLAHPPKVEIARNFEGATLHTIKSDGSGVTPSSGGGATAQTGSFVPINAQATNMSSIFRGIEATPAELALAADFRSKNPILAEGMSDTQLGKIAATLTPEKLTSPSAMPRTETYDETRQRLKVTVTSLANRLAYKTGREPRDVHKAWIKRGNPRHEDANNAQLEEKVNWLVENLERIGVPKPVSQPHLSPAE